MSGVHRSMSQVENVAMWAKRASCRHSILPGKPITSHGIERLVRGIDGGDPQIVQLSSAVTLPQAVYCDHHLEESDAVTFLPVYRIINQIPFVIACATQVALYCQIDIFRTIILRIIISRQGRIVRIGWSTLRMLAQIQQIWVIQIFHFRQPLPLIAKLEVL